MDLTRCNLGKFLVVPTMVPRRHEVRQDARAASGKSWNYFSSRLSCNVEDLTPSTPFSDLILATNTIRLCVLKAWDATNHVNKVMMFAHHIICAAFNFVIWIAPTDKFVYKGSTLSLQEMNTNYYLS